MKRDGMPGRFAFLLLLGMTCLAVLTTQARSPQTTSQTDPVPTSELSGIPEVCLEPPQAASPLEARRHIAGQMERINRLNARKADGFLEALRGERPDLRGLPFVLGDGCRSKDERNKAFTLAAGTIRNALEPVGEDESNPPSPETFWKRFRASCAEQDGRPQWRQEETVRTRIAALMHVLAAKAEMHAGLVSYLATLEHADAAQALTRLAVFSGDEGIRTAAIAALKGRRQNGNTAILLGGLRYPWPAVARQAADAIVRLERRDLLPQLLDALEQPDPRAPVMRKSGDKVVPVVRELVRVNHHRSCLLCHAPGNTGKEPVDIIRAEVPVPGEPLRDKWERCKDDGRAIRQDILVRIDVTYLRPDFSRLLPVKDAQPWPQMQRFDFLVRERVVTEEEAAVYRGRLQPQEAGALSPYQRAALAALRGLSGRDTEPTARAWRRLLELPEGHGATN